jgi:hypothetical protein
MTTLSAVLTVGVRHLAWLPTHPLPPVTKPPDPRARARSLALEEQQRLFAACQQSRNPHLYLVVVLALATATRKNELLQRQWTEIDLERGILSIPRSKNKERRAIPLVPPALELLRLHARYGHHGWVFPRPDRRQPVYVDYAFRAACARAGIQNFHFHDLSHTAASYLAMSGASIQEIAMILGHKTLKQTMRYIHLVEPHTRLVLEKMTQKFLAVPSVESVTPVAPVPPEVCLATPAPPIALEIQILEAVRALEPFPATAVQVASALSLPMARVRDILQDWAQRGTLVRISKGYYRHRASGGGLQRLRAAPVGGANHTLGASHAAREGDRHEQP